MLDVVDKKTGSEMSDLAIDFLRNIPCLIRGCTVLGLNAAALGVVGFDTGGVWLAEKGGIGEVGGWKPFAPALLNPPGDGRGEMGMPGENLADGSGRRGEVAGDPVLV